MPRVVWSGDEDEFDGTRRPSLRDRSRRWTEGKFTDERVHKELLPRLVEERKPVPLFSYLGLTGEIASDKISPKDVAPILKRVARQGLRVAEEISQRTLKGLEILTAWFVARARPRAVEDLIAAVNQSLVGKCALCTRLNEILLDNQPRAIAMA